MPSIRVLHTADLHLGSAFSSYPEQAASLQADQLTLLANLTTICKDHAIRILLIAGDLFDQPQPSRRLVNTVAELFASIPDTAIFIAAGNHDPAFIDSPYRTRSWPLNVNCFTDAITSINLSEMPVSVYGAGFTSTAAPRSLLPADFTTGTPGRLNLLVMHGELVSNTQASDYNPVAIDRLAQSGLHYAAFGHRHEASELLSAGFCQAAYSGCPLGRGFDETGTKSVRFIEFNDKEGTSDWQIKSEKFKTGGRIFSEILLDATEAETNQALADRILEQLRTNENSDSASSWQQNFYRLILTGTVDAGFAIEPLLISNQLSKQLFYTEVIDRTKPALDLSALAAENNLRGTFVRLAVDNIKKAEQYGDESEIVLAQRALLLGLAAYEGEMKPNVDY